MAGILVATDFSDASRKAVDVAAKLARELGQGIILVHALLPPSSHRSKYGSDPIGRLEQDIGRDEALKFHEE